MVQGYYHYYAVPGNIDSLSVFRERFVDDATARVRKVH
jgi:hypothetical protein